MKNKKINNAFFNQLARAAKDNRYGKPEIMVDGDSPRSNCRNLIEAATTFDALFDAIPFCVVSTAGLANADLAQGWLTFFTRKFSALWSSAFGFVPSTTSFLRFWAIFCGEPFQNAFVKVVKKLIDTLRGAGIGGYAESLISAVATVIGQSFTGIPAAEQFFVYFLELAVNGDVDLMKRTIKDLCDRINRLRNMGGEAAEEGAKALFDQLAYLLEVMAGSVTLGVGYVRNLARPVYDWIVAHPGETLTIAAIIAIAAVMIWGTGGLGAPAVPEMAVAVLAIAAALGITHDFTQQDIEDMINQSQGA